MTITQALSLLGLTREATLEDVASAKRRLLLTLHPDKHPPDDAHIFSRLTANVIAAAERLATAIDRRGRRSNRTLRQKSVETLLIGSAPEPDMFDQLAASRKSIVAFDRGFTEDECLAIRVRGVDYEFELASDSEGNTRVCCGLYVAAVNRTRKPISSFSLESMSYLIDNTGYQYAPLRSAFYWWGGDGMLNEHSDFLAARSRIDGLMIFPGLRSGSKALARYVMYGSFQIGPSAEGYETRSYEISLR